MKEIIIEVDGEDNVRLDLYLFKELKEISRTYIQNLIKDKMIYVNGHIKKPRYLVKEGDIIKVKIPQAKETEIIAENIPLHILYEDRDIAIVNKEEGMVVHPAAGHYSGTLVNALLYHIEDLSSINGIIRPGIVHRLDKDTSGLILIAKNDSSHKFLSNQFKARSVKREYIALVHGLVKEDRGTISKKIARSKQDRKKMSVSEENGKEAITEYRVIDRYKDYTLLSLQLRTGRTHQIRVHLSYINHPIVGDQVYGREKNILKAEGHMLHAVKLAFMHPTSKEVVEFETNIPERFYQILNKIK